MKKTSEKLIQNLINNIGHPMFFEGYDVLMRDEKKFLKNEIKQEFRKLKKNISQKFGILIGCILSFIFNLIWLLFVPFYSLIKIIKMMISIPFKVRDHQKLIEFIKSHPQFKIIEEEYSKRK